MPRKLALLYAPPWKIAVPSAQGYGAEGPPPEYREGDLDADFHQTPYGLFALAAAARRAGHQVKVLNLSAFAWPAIEALLAELNADVFGLSCWTANRRGVRYVAQAIKRLQPQAKVVIGGPHASPLARELLEAEPAFDCVCVGESDETLLELLARDEAGQSWLGVAGSLARDEQGKVQRAAARPQVRDLDQLACPQEHFATHILMTSRGCPWSCTFCGAESAWGRGFRANSIEYVLQAIEQMLQKLPVKMFQIKDDTFTTNKARVIKMCRAMRARKINALWSCDTRVDLLTDELCRELRLAGCARLSLGVESGSQRILDLIDKKITTQEILESTELAKRYGIKVRYYMMLGNRGESLESFEESLQFLQRARPHEYVFSCLSIYPGTKDFAEAERSWLDRKVFLEQPFQELKAPFDADEETTAVLSRWFAQNSGLRTLQRDGVAEYREVLQRLPDFHGAHLDLGAAYYHEGQLELAEQHVRRAGELGHPLPGMVHNHLACIAYARGDLDAMMDHFSAAARLDPQHWVLMQNVQKAREWFKRGGYQRGEPLALQVRHDFQLLERTIQPTLPGPLPDDVREWQAPLPPVAAAAFLRTPEQEGSQKGLRLRVM